MKLLLLALVVAWADEPVTRWVDPEVTRLKEELAQFPEDYATAAALARRATLMGDTTTALQAWEAAERISGGTLELYLERALLHLDGQRVSEALQDARAATILGPDSPAAWLTLAWVRRQVSGPPGLSSFAAAAAYDRTLKLDPASGEATCGLGWLRAERGDRLGALTTLRKAVDLGSRDCALPGLRSLEPMPWQVWSGLFLSGSLFQDEPLLDHGFNASANVGVSLADLVHLEVAGRVITVATSAPENAPGRLTSGPANQQEVWGRGGLAHGGHGAEVLAGYLHVGGTNDREVVAVGGRAWTTWWATVLGGFTWSQHVDGANLQANLDLRLPLTRQLSLQLGAQLTHLTIDDVNVEIKEEGLHPSGSLSATWAADRWSISAGGRGGPETRPIRLDEPSMWNFNQRIFASGFVRGSVQVHEAMRLHLGYEVLRLDRPGQVIANAPDPHNHLLTAGLTVSIHHRTHRED
jgi:hypothetical protein